MNRNIVLKNFSYVTQRDKNKNFERKLGYVGGRIRDPSIHLKGMQIEENRNQQWRRSNACHSSTENPSQLYHSEWNPKSLKSHSKLYQSPLPQSHLPPFWLHPLLIFTLFQPHSLHCSSLNFPGMPQHQNFSTCYSLCLEISSPRKPHGLLPHLLQLFPHLIFLRKTFPDHPV